MPLVNIKLDECFTEEQTVLSQARAELPILTLREKTGEERFFLSSVCIVDNDAGTCVLCGTGPSLLHIVAAVIVVESFIIAIFVGQTIFDLLDSYEL